MFNVETLDTLNGVALSHTGTTYDHRLLDSLLVDINEATPLANKWDWFVAGIEYMVQSGMPVSTRLEGLVYYRLLWSPLPGWDWLMAYGEYLQGFPLAGPVDKYRLGINGYVDRMGCDGWEWVS